MVALGPPPPTTKPRPQHLVLPNGAPLFRIFDPTRYSATATTFRYNGPRERFDHQRGQPDPVDPAVLQPTDDAERGILYLGHSISCCVVEVFGDGRRIVRGDRCLAQVALLRPLRLLDLRGAAAMRAGTVAALASTDRRALSWAWARWFYESVRLYGAVDGLVYGSAHNGEDCYAVFERAATALTVPDGHQVRLDDPELAPLLLKIADEHNVVLVS